MPKSFCRLAGKPERQPVSASTVPVATRQFGWRAAAHRSCCHHTLCTSTCAVHTHTCKPRRRADGGPCARRFARRSFAARTPKPVPDLRPPVRPATPHVAALLSLVGALTDPARRCCDRAAQPVMSHQSMLVYSPEPLSLVQEAHEVVCRLTIAQLAEHLTVVDMQTSECPWFDSEW